MSTKYGKTRGTTNDGRGGQLKRTPNFRRSTRIDFNDPVLEAALGATVATVLTGGDALMIASTLGGGAVRLMLLQGDDKSSTVCTDTAELLDGLAAVRSVYTAMDYEPGAEG